MEGNDRDAYNRLNDTKNKIFQNFMQFENDNRANYNKEHDKYKPEDFLSHFGFNQGPFQQMNRKYFYQITLH